MNNYEIEAEINKLKFHVSILAEALDWEKHAHAQMIISNDWSHAEVDKMHAIFEKWDKILADGGKVVPADFEFDFQTELGVSYQGVKSVVVSLYAQDQWTTVIESFVDNMGEHPSVEYLEIKHRPR